MNKYINNLINSAGIVLIFVSLIGAMQSRILWLDKLSNGLIVTITISLILLFLFITFAKKSLFQKVFSFIRLYEKRIFWIFFIFCIIYQIVLVITLNGTPKFDSYRLIHVEDIKAISDYLSVNSNNNFLFFINYYFIKIFGFSYMNFRILNSLIIFTSTLLFLKISKELFGKTVSYFSTISFMMFAIIQPLYLVPYTDTYCLLPVFLSIYFITICIKSKKTFSLIFSSIGSAFFIAISYLTRPSSITFIIAVLLFILINLYKKDIRIKSLISFPPFLLTVILTLTMFNLFVSNQKIVKIDKSKELPMAHFILMGSFGDEDNRESIHGTWNAGDLKSTLAEKNKSDKSKKDIELFVERTANRGLARTIKFYGQKYFQTTDTGVIGYHRDGLWLNYSYSANGSLSNKIQQIYYGNGKLRPSFNFLCQFFWIITLILSIIALYFNRTWKVGVVTLSLLGGLLFLLIFESGGTKYMFQYIYLICLLSGLGISYCLNRFSGDIAIQKEGVKKNEDEQTLNNSSSLQRRRNTRNISKRSK